MTEIQAIYGLRAGEAEAIAEMDLYAFWSRALAREHPVLGAHETAKELAEQLDSALVAASAATHEARSGDTSIAAAERALSNLQVAGRHLATARSLLADERNAVIHGAAQAVRICEAAIDGLIMASGAGVAASLFRSSKLVQVGASAGTRLVLASGAEATKQHYSGENIDVFRVLLAGVNSAVEPGAKALAAKLATRIPGVESALGNAATQAFAQVLQEVWEQIDSVLQDKPPPAFNEALSRVIAAAVFGAVEAKCNAKGWLESEAWRKSRGNAQTFLSLYLNTPLFPFVTGRKKVFINSILDASDKAASHVVRLIAGEIDRDPRSPIGGPIGATELSIELTALQEAVDDYRRERGQYASGPAGHRLLTRIAEVLKHQQHDFYRCLPLVEIEDLHRHTGWITGAANIARLAVYYGLKVRLAPMWDLKLFEWVIDESDQIIQKSKHNTGRHVPILVDGREDIVSVSRARKAVDVLRQWYQRIPFGPVLSGERPSVKQLTVNGASGLGAAGKVLPKPLPGMIGNVAYYQARNNDYLSRHDAPPPPDYYLNYGNKYARRFTTVLRPTLSANGQRWLDKTFVLLQTAMENRLVKDRAAYDALEMDADAFRSFAYGTHPDAYIAGGLSGLVPTDLAKIASTPDINDLLTLDGVSQVLETGVRLVPEWGGKAYDGAKNLGGKALDGAADGLED